MIMHESWLTDGNCSECRRRTYCKRPCKKSIDRANAIKAVYIANTVDYVFKKIRRI